MTGLEDLPEELLVRVIKFSNRAELAKVRLTNHRLKRIATAQFFHSVTLYPHWIGQDAIEDDRYSIDCERDDVWTWNGMGEPAQLIVSTDDGDAQSTESDNPPMELCATGSSVSELSMSQEKDAMSSGDEASSSNGRIPKWARRKFPGPPGYDAQKFMDLLHNSNLRRCVQEVEVYTCDTHCDHHPSLAHRWFDGWWPSPAYHRVYHECIRRLGNFPNVRSLVVHFDRHATDDDEEDTFQHPEFQKVWLRRILHPLQGRLDEISIRHYENTGDTATVPRSETPVLMESLSNVKSLRMSVKHRETNPDGGPIYRYANIHPFWGRFVDRFLRSSSKTLSTLVLYSDVPFGWFPKLDLRSIHFERLRSLTLGHYIFHQDHTFNWITNHHETLHELNLDRCSILYQVGHSIQGWLDEEGYPIGKDMYNIGYPDFGWSPDPVGCHASPDLLQFSSSSLRWHQIFSLFAHKLQNLRTFRFGTSEQWNFNTESKFEERGGGCHQLPVMPWMDEHNIVSSILDDRYAIWDDWTQQYRARWGEGEAPFAPSGVSWTAELLQNLEEFPDCRNQDSDALQALLKMINRRGS